MKNTKAAQAFLKSLAKLMEKYNVTIHVAGYEGETMYMSIDKEIFNLVEDEWKLNSVLCEAALAKLNG